MLICLPLILTGWAIAAASQHANVNTAMPAKNHVPHHRCRPCHCGVALPAGHVLASARCSPCPLLPSHFITSSTLSLTSPNTPSPIITRSSPLFPSLIYGVMSPNRNISTRLTISASRLNGNACASPSTSSSPFLFSRRAQPLLVLLHPQRRSSQMVPRRRLHRSQHRSLQPHFYRHPHRGLCPHAHPACHRRTV